MTCSLNTFHRIFNKFLAECAGALSCQKNKCLLFHLKERPLLIQIVLTTLQDFLLLTHVQMTTFFISNTFYTYAGVHFILCHGIDCCWYFASCSIDKNRCICDKPLCIPSYTFLHKNYSDKIRFKVKNKAKTNASY